MKSFQQDRNHISTSFCIRKTHFWSLLNWMLQISLILRSTQFEWSVRGLVCCCQHGTHCSFLYLFPWPMRFSPYKDSLCLTVSLRDGLHSPLLSGRRKRGGWWKEGGKEGGKEWGSEWVREGRKRTGAVQQWRTWQLSAGQKDCAEHLLLSPTPLQPPHYLSIYHKAARSNVCSSQDSHREGRREEGGGEARKERREGEGQIACLGEQKMKGK